MDEFLEPFEGYSSGSLESSGDHDRCKPGRVRGLARFPSDSGFTIPYSGIQLFELEGVEGTQSNAIASN